LAFCTKKCTSLLLNYALNWHIAFRTGLFIFTIDLEKLLECSGFVINSAEIRNCGAVIFDSFFENILSVFNNFSPIFFKKLSGCALRMNPVSNGLSLKFPGVSQAQNYWSSGKMPKVWIVQ